MKSKYHPANAFKLCAITAAALLIVACGGGEGDDGKNSAAPFATSTGVKTNGVLGQGLYAANCASCHGASMPAGVNYLRTLNAIAANKGGMGVLAATIKTSQADDIATYLAFGAVSSLPAQTITFADPITQTIGVVPGALVASASSNLSVSFASTTPAVCTVSGTTLALVAAGACTVTASQTGNASFAPATPVSNTFAINAAPGAPTFTAGTPVGSLNVSATATPSQFTFAVTSNSAGAITYAATTPLVCSATTAGTVTVIAVGTCTINVSQVANGSFTALSNPYPFTLLPAPVVGVAATGAVLYTASCAVCHGAKPPGSIYSRNIITYGANAPLVISNAITTGRTSVLGIPTNMGGLSSMNFTAQNFADMAAYLATPGF